MSVISNARLALQLALAGEEYAARLFAEGSTPGGIITTPANLSPQQAAELRASWEQYHRGLSRSHRVAVLDNDAKWAPVDIAPEDSQFLESRKFQVQEIARMFGVPPHLLMDSSGSTSWGSGLEEQGRNMITYTLGPWITRFEQAVTFRVLARYPRLSGAFNMDGLLRGSELQRYQVYAIGRRNNILSINDARRREGLPTIGPEGDVYTSAAPTPALPEPTATAGSTEEEAAA